MGAGFGLAKELNTFGFAPDRNEAQEMLVVCGTNGELGWLPTAQARIISVDGKSPHALLANDTYR